MAFLFHESSPSTTFVLASLVVFSLSFFSVGSAEFASVSQEQPPYHYQGCPNVDLSPGQEYAKVNHENDELWGNGNGCGRRYKMTCTAMVDKGEPPCQQADPSTHPSIIVTVAGSCSRCSDIVMTKEAFSLLAKPQILHPLKFDYVRA